MKHVLGAAPFYEDTSVIDPFVINNQHFVIVIAKLGNDDNFTFRSASDDSPLELSKNNKPFMRMYHHCVKESLNV